ncbi:hypothetical protein FRC03_006264 [Tulasnella sp. 419]|nr:hypothetical protein FRC03_006264 [Tulasnella sp. 419]
MVNHPPPLDSVEKRKTVADLAIIQERPITVDPESENAEAHVVCIPQHNRDVAAAPQTSPKSVRFYMEEINYVRSPVEMPTGARGAPFASPAPFTAGTQLELLLINQRRSYFGRHNTPREEQLRNYVVVAIAPILKKLECSQVLKDNHQASITHLEFSSDGKYFASGSIDHSAIIWKVDELEQQEQYEFYAKLKHVGEGASVQQVAWSPKDACLLTRSRNHIELWTAKTERTINIARYNSVQSVAWRSDGQAFIALDNNRIHVLDDTGNEDGQHLLCIAVVLKPTDEKLKWSKCKLEKRLVAYNVESGEIENQSPILNTARNVTIGKEGRYALVSYEDRHPPELWEVSVNDDKTLKISLRYACEVDQPVMFTGDSNFGGADDKFVICATENGKIYIWDTQTGYLLHLLQAQQTRGDPGRITGIAWRKADIGTHVVASGHGDGTIRVWRANAPDVPADHRKNPT